MALEKLEVREGLGMEVGLDWFGPNFTVFDFGWHYHRRPKHESVVDHREVCPFRAGVYVTLFGIRVAFGKFASYKKAL